MSNVTDTGLPESERSASAVEKEDMVLTLEGWKEKVLEKSLVKFSPTLPSSVPKFYEDPKFDENVFDNNPLFVFGMESKIDEILVREHMKAEAFRINYEKLKSLHLR